MEIAADNPMYAAPAASPEAVNQGAVDDLTKRLDALMPGLWFVCWLVMLGRGIAYVVAGCIIILLAACIIILILACIIFTIAVCIIFTILACTIITILACTISTILACTIITILACTIITILITIANTNTLSILLLPYPPSSPNKPPLFKSIPSTTPSHSLTRLVEPKIRSLVNDKSLSKGCVLTCSCGFNAERHFSTTDS